MATPPNEKSPVPAESDHQSDDAQTTDAVDNNIQANDASEISMRINFLGKLIIPPTPH